VIDQESERVAAIMHRCFRWASGLATLVAAAIAFSGAAEAAATDWVGDQHAEARLVTAVEATGSSRVIDAGLEIKVPPGWHTYWRTPGDAGIPTVIDWTGSTNLAHSQITWPAPTRLTLQGFENYVYLNHVVLPIAIELAKPGEALQLHAAADYASCAEVCIPYHAEFSLTLPAGLATPSAEAPLIAAARAQVPGDLAQAHLTLESVTAAPTAGDSAVITVRLRSTGAPFRATDLFVEGLPRGSAGRSLQVSVTDGARILVLAAPVSGIAASTLSQTPLTFTVTDGSGRAAEFMGTAVLAVASADTPGVLAILAIALLGGLILNLMPCVLPVLSLKLLAVAGLSGADRRQVRLGLVTTAAGVVASFAVLAAALIILKQAGATIGWGIQFQQPWFLAGMAVITALFAANLWGWLEIDLPGAAYAVAAPRTARPLISAFLTGALATLLATPCSAPFVGTAVGFALARDPREIVMIFAALGLGLASPYLLAAAVPRVVSVLPRPGRWMLWLRRVLGVLLAATALWLIFVLAQVAGWPAAMAAGLLLLAGAASLAWRGIASPGTPVRRVASAITVLLAVATIFAPTLAARSVIAAVDPPAVDLWQPFDPAVIPRDVSEGKVVFVDVTAAWCLTCKVNEAAVIDRDPVASHLRDAGVVAMRADWTRPDPAISAYLQSFGRYGVPLNVVYGPGTPAGEALPELLTTDIVIQALDRAAVPGIAKQ
jgi:suppressor for copper-sensitivity B